MQMWHYELFSKSALALFCASVLGFSHSSPCHTSFKTLPFSEVSFVRFHFPHACDVVCLFGSRVQMEANKEYKQSETKGSAAFGCSPPSQLRLRLNTFAITIWQLCKVPVASFRSFAPHCTVQFCSFFFVHILLLLYHPNSMLHCQNNRPPFHFIRLHTHRNTRGATLRNDAMRNLNRVLRF